ncbi:DNA polymerase III subunit beta [Dictyobacter alpinus]|uniref:DNA polymerase III subunit beta n=1 Tax=Dictyobacter alpinus TaxID=2014873 RepID=A0A402BKU5_9CHLR|nr:DNA polymerase III subunit beta [Dictyobacter alpinus]GCE31974.1 DNA polymerase III subunit beta [Dictyobacter alpinus]
MQFTINQAELMSALGAVKAPCKGRFALEVLNNVLIEARDGVVSFTTTDLTMRVTFTAAHTVKVAEEGAYTVNYKQLFDTIKVLPKRADIAVRRLEGTVEITCSGRKFVRGIEAEEYPDWKPAHVPGETYTETREEYEPDSSGNGSTRVTNTYKYEVLKTQIQQLCLPRNLLVGMLSQVAYVAADDDSRPVYRAIFTDLRDDRLTMVAADAFRLVKHVVDVPCAGSWEHAVLIDAKYFAQIGKLLPKDCGVDIEVLSTLEKVLEKNGKEEANTLPYLTISQVRFATDTTVVLLRPTEGTYPNYEGALPKSYSTRVVCDTAELLSGYQTIWPVAKDSSNIAKLRITGDTAFIEASAEEQPEPTVHEIPAIVSGPDTHALLNCQYMLDFLKATKASEVVIEMTTPARPVVARPCYEGPGEQTIYIVMPMTPNR